MGFWFCLFFLNFLVLGTGSSLSRKELVGSHLQYTIVPPYQLAAYCKTKLQCSCCHENSRARHVPPRVEPSEHSEHIQRESRRLGGHQAADVRLCQRHPGGREGGTARASGTDPGRWREKRPAEVKARARPQDTSDTSSPAPPYMPGPLPPTEHSPRTHTPCTAVAGPVLPGELPQRGDHGGHAQALLRHGSALNRAARHGAGTAGRRPAGPKPPPPALLGFNRFVSAHGAAAAAPGRSPMAPAGPSPPRRGSAARSAARTGNTQRGLGAHHRALAGPAAAPRDRPALAGAWWSRDGNSRGWKKGRAQC